MTAPRREPLAKERVEELIEIFAKSPDLPHFTASATWMALRELLEARERIAAYRELVEIYEQLPPRLDENYNANCKRRWDRIDALHSKIGTWCEPKAKDAKEGAG